MSDGHQIENPKFATAKKTKRTLKIRQRRVNRKVKGSKNWKKAAKKSGLFHHKISNKRQAYHWKIAREIAKKNVEAIALKKLNL